jgi:hypothetical protein
MPLQLAFHPEDLFPQAAGLLNPAFAGLLINL